MKKELGKIGTQCMEKLVEQDSAINECKFTTDRIDRMYGRMKDDIIRHETLCFEIAKKFES